MTKHDRALAALAARWPSVHWHLLDGHRDKGDELIGADIGIHAEPAIEPYEGRGWGACDQHGSHLVGDAVAAMTAAIGCEADRCESIGESGDVPEDEHDPQDYLDDAALLRGMVLNG